MSEQNRDGTQTEERKRRGLPRWLLPGLAAAVLLAAALFVLLRPGGGTEEPTVPSLDDRLEQLRAEALREEILSQLGDAPAGEAGHAAFVSVSDGTARARVYSAAGESAAAAVDAAAALARQDEACPQPIWVKLDLVFKSYPVPTEELETSLRLLPQNCLRFGVSPDPLYASALLEAEANSGGVYRYGEGSGVDLGAFNSCLSLDGRPALAALPENWIAFQTVGFFCGPDGQVVQLEGRSEDFGHRRPESLDDQWAAGLVTNAAAYLASQVREDGTFVYGVNAAAGEELSGYSPLYHAGALWSMIRGWRVSGGEDLAAAIRSAADWLQAQAVYDPAGSAYIRDAGSGELRLGASAMGVVALTEYADAFGDERYNELCLALGRGILASEDMERGLFNHVLNEDFTVKNPFRTVSYDGQALTALCRLYAATGDAVWLDCARRITNDMIVLDYTQYGDLWVSCGMNELTKYVTDSAEYYGFALDNVQNNLEQLSQTVVSDPESVELLMESFELYMRLRKVAESIEGFDLSAFVSTILSRVERQMDTCVYPEYAMYFNAPQRTLNAFMNRTANFRVRIDDVQHGINGYYLYWKNYPALLELLVAES